MTIQKERVNEHEIRIPRQGNMKVDATIYASEEILLEDTAVAQLADGASISGVKRALATPDIHQGYGVPIGSVLGLDNVISPAAVGYDINCGMRMLRTDMQADEAQVDRLARAVRRYIPLGEGKSNVKLNSNRLEVLLAKGVKGLSDVTASDHPVWEMIDEESLNIDTTRIEDGGSLPGTPGSLSKRAIQRGTSQLGTLGGGNHFIEFQIVDEIYNENAAARFGLRKGQLVVMIHSGSRGLGHQIGSEYMKIANNNGIKGPVPSLDVNSAHGRDYWGAMNAGANYAFINRHIMGLLTQRALLETYPDSRPGLVYDVPHNIAKLEDHAEGQLLVHRKGATRAFGPKRMSGTSFGDTGQPVLIPGSMGTASYILAGIDSNSSSLASVNHGAGRVMGRIAARGKYKGNRQVRPPAISDRQFEQSMEGVYLVCENRKTIKEEAPGAYKDIDLVMDTVTGARLANRVARMRPLAVLKG